MFKNPASYVLFGIGIAALLFSLVRTYYLVWRQRRERQEAMERAREAARRLNRTSLDEPE